MNRRDVDRALSAANPIDLRKALPPLTAAEREFLVGVVAEPQERAAAERSGWLRRGLAAKSMTLAAVGAGALALLLLPSSGRGPAPVSPEPAYATELARIAKQGSPAVVYAPVRKGSRSFVVSSRVFVLEPRQGTDGRTYALKRLDQLDRTHDGSSVVHPAAVWDCGELPCDRKAGTPQEARELFRSLQRSGN